MEFMTSGPVLLITGFVREKDDRGQKVDPKWDVSPGALSLRLRIRTQGAEWFICEPRGRCAEQRDAEKPQRPTIHGWSFDPYSREASAQKRQSVPEMLHRAAENAALASFTSMVSRKLEAALKLWASGLTPRMPI